MEGPLLAEFSNVNALNQKGASQYGGQRGQSAPVGSTDDQRERLLRGDTTYTDSIGHFIEDQPQTAQLGVSYFLPDASTTEERDRLLRRLEMCAKAREESTKIMSVRFAHRDQLKTDNKNDHQNHKLKLMDSQREREERWTRKLQRSPFAVDLVAENQRIDEENRVRDHMEMRRQRLMSRRNREAHNAIFKRATAETDELDQLRAEKRMLLENERQLKALKDVEKSNARTAQILQERRKQQLEKQKNQLQQVVVSQVTGIAGGQRAMA